MALLAISFVTACGHSNLRSVIKHRDKLKKVCSLVVLSRSCYPVTVAAILAAQ